MSTIIVTSSDDSGPDTLKQAILDTNDGGTIVIDVQIINLSSAIVIYKPLIIEGNNTIITSTGDRLFAVTSSVKLNNIQFHGPEIHISGNSDISIDNCTFITTTRYSDQDTVSCAIYYAAKNGSLSVSGSMLTYNMGYGLCIAGLGNQSINIDSSTFCNNGLDNIRIMTRGGTLTITNSTISDSSGSGIFNKDALSINLSNSTVVNNNCSGISSSKGTVTLNNTIVANNTLNGKRRDIEATVDSNSHNNLISVSGGFTGMTNNVNGNVIGSPKAPVDPMLGPYDDYGGKTLMYPLLLGSPAIGAGNIAYVNSQFDQRGEGFPRSSDVVDIGAFQYHFFDTPCFDGEALVLVKTGETIEEIPVKEVIANKHKVYDTKNQTFVMVKNNAVSYGATRLCLIEKGSIFDNIPHTDIKLTSGHYVIVNDKEVKAKYCQGAKKIKVPSQKIYTICTNQRVPISVNGLEAMTWNATKWRSYSKRSNISWFENK